MWYRYLLVFLLLIISFNSILSQNSGFEDSLLNKYEKSKGKEDKIDALTQLINKYINADLEKAHQYSSELLKIGLESNNDEAINTAYSKLGLIEKKKGNYEKSIVFCKKNLEHAYKLNDNQNISRSLNNLGLLHYKIGEYSLSLNYLNNSLQIKEAAKDSFGMAASYNNIGMLFKDINSYDQSLKYFFKSLEIKTNIDTNGSIYSTYNNIGTVYHEIDKYDQALEYYNKAVDACQENDNLLEIPNLLLNIGLLYKEKEDMEMALIYYEKSLVLSDKYGLKGEKGKGLLLIGSIYYELEGYEKAKLYNEESLDIFYAIKDKYNLTSALHNLGKTNYKIKNFKKAIYYLEESNEVSLLLNLKSKTSKNYKFLSLIYEELNEHNKSLIYFKNHITYKDSIYNEESHKRLIKIQIEHEVKEKERDIEKLEQSEIVKDLKITKRTNFIIILIIISLFLLSVIFLVVQKNIYTKKTSKKLREQQDKIHNQEKNKLILDLEVKNKELTTNVMNLIEKNELIQNTANSLVIFKKDFEKNDLNNIDDIIKNLKLNANKGLWNEFEKYFSEVYNDFYVNLMKKHSTLTPNERKLCAFLRLDMTTKDIAIITLRTSHSINVARTRLRKKMGIANTETNISTYLTQF